MKRRKGRVGGIIYLLENAWRTQNSKIGRNNLPKKMLLLTNRRTNSTLKRCLQVLKENKETATGLS